MDDECEWCGQPIAEDEGLDEDNRCEGCQEGAAYRAQRSADFRSMTR